MVKEPVAGRVKTRLARDVGTVAATFAYRTMLRQILLRLSSDRRWQTIAAVTPDTAVHSRMLPSLQQRMPQGRGDLGTRMRRLFLRMPAGPTLLVGSDIPGVSRPAVAAAFASLIGRDAVIGPAGDGGYWLVGFADPHHARTAFRGVRWSGPHALDDTLASLAGRRVGLVARLHDIDRSADLRLWRADIGRIVPPGQAV